MKITVHVYTYCRMDIPLSPFDIIILGNTTNIYTYYLYISQVPENIAFILYLLPSLSENPCGADLPCLSLE